MTRALNVWLMEDLICIMGVSSRWHLIVAGHILGGYTLVSHRILVLFEESHQQLARCSRMALALVVVVNV